jgi:putative flippase GtrA
MTLGQYSRFVFVGAFVGVLTVACRELLGYWLAADTRANFTISIVLAYAFGIVLSFVLNHRFTFGAGTARSFKAFLRFVMVALLGLATTALLSLGLRYGANLDALLGPLAKPAAFGTATVLTTFLTSPLNSRFVFGSQGPSAAAAGCAR